jgi:hypothetical protein
MSLLSKEIFMYKVQNIKPDSETGYGFFLVEHENSGMEMGTVSYHVEGVSSPTACKTYPTEAVAQAHVSLYVAALNAAAAAQVLKRAADYVADLQRGTS